MDRSLRRIACFALLLACLAAGGCEKEVQVKPDYNRPLPPGANALRVLLDRRDWPDLKQPWQGKDANLTAALDRSIGWFAAPSTQQYFTAGQFTHLRARTSVYAFKQLLEQSNSPESFERAVQEQFNCYISVGYDDKGGVLYTGYYTPIFKGSRTPDGVFRYPLHKKPADLVLEPATGKPLGRRVGSAVQPWPPRREIESSGMLKGTELVYVADKFEAYIIHVNGSAKLELPDGSTMHIGYAGKTDRPYKGIGKAMVDEGKIPAEKLSLKAIKDYFRQHPAEQDKYINANESYVFFTEYDGATWPAGSLGVKVADFRTLATDKDVFPRGGVVVVNTTIPTVSGAQRPFNQFMLDQDTGGAIRAAGRGDIYMGIGPQAETLAGHQFAEGKLHYFFLRNERVLEWHQKMLNDPATRGGARKPAAEE
jgi:membrane-bound lytic murein transglycosylase A